MLIDGQPRRPQARNRRTVRISARLPGFLVCLLLAGVACGGGSAKPDGAGAAGMTGAAGTAGGAGTSGTAGTAGTAGAAGSIIWGTPGYAGTLGGGGAIGVAGTGGEAIEHRPVAVPCAPTGGTRPDPDAGALWCVTAADCAPDGGYNPFFCFGGWCSVDQCLEDGDCAPYQACVCSSDFVGLTIRQNICAPSSCRSDADCGPGGLCSPAHNGHCGSPSGYHCRKPADKCRVQADCASASVDAGSSSCGYVPEVDLWECKAVIACGG